MGAGNPRFADMELYSPDTYYLTYYDYEDNNWEEAYEDFKSRLYDAFGDIEFDGSKFEFLSEQEEYESEDVGMCGSRETAWVMAEHRFCTICIGSESTADDIIFGIIPLDFENYISLVENTEWKDLGQPMGFNEDAYNEGYDNYMNSIDEHAYKLVEEETKQSYENYIKKIFEPIKTKVLKKIYSLYKGHVRMPDGAWCSHKVEFEDED